MSGRVGHRKWLICVNEANLRANHLYLTDHADQRTTRRYDHRKRQVTRNILERISI